MDRNNGGVFIICVCLLRNEQEIFGVRTPLTSGSPLAQRG
jgi:hypothetical protein